MVGDALCAQFLHKAHRAAEQQHAAYNDDRRSVAAEIGSQNDIGHQRDDGQQEQNDRKGIDERAAQTEADRVRRSARDRIAAKLCAAFFRLFGAQTVRRDMQMVTDRVGFQHGALADTRMNRTVHRFTSEKTRFSYHTIQSARCLPLKSCFFLAYLD